MRLHKFSICYSAESESFNFKVSIWQAKVRSHITTNETFSLKTWNENEHIARPGWTLYIHAKIIALFLASPRASRLTSPFVAATRRIRAFSAPVPKPNNAADESKEKLKGKAGGMHEGRPPPRGGYGGRTIRQIASSQHVVSNKKLLPQGKTSWVQSLSTRTHAKLFLCQRFCSLFLTSCMWSFSSLLSPVKNV